MSELEKESRFWFVWYEYGYQLLDGWFDWNWFWIWFWWIWPPLWPPLTPWPFILGWLLEPFPTSSFCPCCCCWCCCCCCCWCCCWWWWCMFDWLMERLGAIWPNSFISGFSSSSSTQLDAGFSPCPSSVSLKIWLSASYFKQPDVGNSILPDP